MNSREESQSPNVVWSDDYESSQSPMSISSDSSHCSASSGYSSRAPSCSPSSSASSSWWCDYQPYDQFAQTKWYRDDRGLYQQQSQRHPATEPRVAQKLLLDIVSRGSAGDLQLYLKDFSCNLNFVGFSGDSPLHVGCRTGNLEMVKILIGRGADPEMTNRDGWSPLHLAIFAGYQDVVYYLLSLTSQNNTLSSEKSVN